MVFPLRIMGHHYSQLSPSLYRTDNNISKERAAQLLQHLKEEAEDLTVCW